MRAIRVLGLLLLLFGLTCASAHGQSVATWIDSSGNWSNAANWSTNPVVPNDGGGIFYNAVINGTGADTITFDASGTTINALALGAGETLQDNGHAPTLTIGDPSAPTASSFTNNGAVNWANGSALVLNLPTSGPSVNNGTINVTGGASLVVNGQLLNFGTVDINHSSLTGSFNYNPSGLPGGTGSLVIENGSAATLSVLGTFSTFFGQVTTVETGSILNVGTIFNFESSVQVLNGGTVTAGFIDNTNGILAINRGTVNLGTYSDVGLGDIDVQNGGVLNVTERFHTVLGTFSISGNSVFNAPGLDTGGGSFTVDHSLFNVAGDLTNIDGSNLAFQDKSTVVVAGSVNTELMTIDQSTVVVQGSFLSNNLSIRNATSLNVLGDLGNFGTLTITTPGAGSIVNVGGTFTNSSGSILAMGGTSDILNVQGSCANSGAVMLGSLGTLNANGGLTNSGGTLSISSSGTLNTSNYSQSSGSTDVSGNLTSHSYSQSGGSTTIETGGKLTAITFTATGGTVTVNGILDPTAVEFGSGALLDGTGTIIGNVAMGGTIMPGPDGTPGTLTILGNYEQLDTGIFEDLIGPFSQSLLNVNGDVALDSGSFLQIVLLDGYNPLGQRLTVMDYDSLVGEFSNGSSFWEDGYLWDISYGQNGMEVMAVQTPEPGSVLLLTLGLIAMAGFVRRSPANSAKARPLVP